MLPPGCAMGCCRRQAKPISRNGDWKIKVVHDASALHIRRPRAPTLTCLCERSIDRKRSDLGVAVQQASTPLSRAAAATAAADGDRAFFFPATAATAAAA
eukprot:CAMPEP_0177401018 /NCGR_PEP_ID=MMETSP0368-20130122/59419_1 /TAXON_ID=447022 ORGANISM="Scrippsiella hangoei-like, Strain SHHI-4" /NCGR_SAMPLE_ID=MMETSP0368 /ASSEMBLY_ACC=CAM_ASM_000363 /LENGTH=99 /DNA_ID=CAMNT_0018868557 /DNA_START=55 /DNA_END=352 /DNA_ORIENTATION=-